MKYESETGESMEKPGKKLKKLIVITGTTGVVYAGFKYLLPLVAPFFIAYLFALMLRPSARFLSYRLKLRIKGKTHHLPIGVVGGVEFLLLISLLERRERCKETEEIINYNRNHGITERCMQDLNICCPSWLLFSWVIS